MWSRGSIVHAVCGLVTVFWVSTSRALCGSQYGDNSVGSMDDTTSLAKLFVCSEGTFLRSVVFAAYSTSVVGIQFECSDGELSDVYGDDVIGHYVASCPDAEGYGIGSISVKYDEGFSWAEVSCSGDQACRGYVTRECENGEDAALCMEYGEADICGPVSGNPNTSHVTSSVASCTDLEDSYIIGFRMFTKDGGGGDGVKYLTPICALKEDCPADRPDGPLDSTRNVINFCVLGVAGVFILLGLVIELFRHQCQGCGKWPIFELCLPDCARCGRDVISNPGKNFYSFPGRVSAALAAAFTAGGAALTEVLTGSYAVSIGFLVTGLFSLLFAYHYHGKKVELTDEDGQGLFPAPHLQNL